MASELNTKSDIRPAGRSLPPTTADGRPSKIPVRSDTSSGSASDDSDDAKSSLRAKRYGKSKIPRAVPKNVATSKSTEAAGNKTLHEKCPQRSGMQQELSSTANSSGANPKVGGAKIADKKQTAKPKGGLKRREHEESPSLNKARSNALGSRQDMGIQKKLTKTSKLTPKTGGNAKKRSGLPEEEQEKPKCGTTSKKSALKHPVLSKVNNEKLPKQRQSSASASKKEITPQERKNNETPCKLKSDVAIEKEEVEVSDSSLSESSSESEPRSFEYEAESDELLASDSDAECVSKESQSHAKEQNENLDQQEILDCVHDNGDGLQCVPEEAHGHANESSKEQHADSAERKVAFCEPKEVLERRARPIIRGFRDDRKININFAYETESDEFTSTEYSESEKEKSEEKKDEKREDSPAQSSEKKDHSSLEAGEDLALTDCEIESISEDSDIEQQVCVQKHNNELCGSTSTEIARSTEEKNVLQDCTKTQVETAKEGGQNAEVKPPSEMTRKSSEPQSYGEDCEVTISDKHKSEDSDDSFFGINVAKFYGCNTTGQNATCMADDMKPKQNTFHIDRNDPQDIDDSDYLGKNFESLQNESYILKAINDEVRAGFSPESESVSEDVEGTKIKDKSNRKFEIIQKCRMLISFEEIPYENGKDKKKVDGDAFVTELDEMLSATEPDTEGDSRNYQARNTSGVPNKTTSLIEEGYIHHKPPIAPKQQLKQRALEKRNEPERALKFDGTSVKALKQTKERLPKDSPTAKPEQIVEEVCLPSDNKSDVLLWRKEKQTFDGILKASNESSKKGKTASTSGTSGTQSTQVAGPRGSRLTISGMSNSGSTTAGGSGDDDPNDPTRRPQRQKEPDDKKDEETEEQRRKLVKKKLINQMVGMADDFLQNEHQSLNETLFTRRPSKELEISLEATSASDLSSSSTEGTSLEVNCVQGDEEQSFNCCAGVGKEFEDEGTLIKALTSENNLLKKEVSKLKTDVYQKPKEVMQVQDKNKTYKNVISKMEVDSKLLEVEEIELTQECKELTNKEIVKELRRLHAEISEASKELASEDVMESELRGHTSSPLSVELAEVDDFSLQKQPEVDETSEIVTLMHSITAMTEELKDQIARNKTKLAKAYSNSSLIELDEVGHDSVKLRELQKEIADLQEQLKEERTKFRTFESICKNRIEENKNLRDRIQELESELAKSDDRRKETQTYKNRELINIRNNMESKGNKVDHLVHELCLLSERNDVQKSVIESLNCRIHFRESREIELESLVDELTTENEKLLQQVSKEKSNTKKYQRENDERIAAHSVDVTRLECALQDKIDELVDVLSSIDNFYAGDQPLPDHPCMGAIENGIKILYDVSGLLKAIGGPDSQSGEVREAVNETKKRELEIMIEDLSKEVNILKADKQRLQIKLKMNGECREDTGNEQSKMEDEMLRQQLDERETQLNGLEQQMTTLQSDNASLSKLLGDIKELASKDAEVHRLQLDEHLNRMEVLQEENDKQNAQIKALNESLLDCQDKNQAQKTEIEDLELGKEALQYKVKMKVKEVLEHMAKHEALKKRVQEVTAEKEAFQERLEKRGKELSEHKMKIKELIKKLETMDAEKEALEQKFSQAQHEVDNETTDTKSMCTGEVVSEPPCNCTMAGSSGKANDLKVQNEELKEKLELYETFLAQVKTEKAEYSKALEESRKNVMMVRKNSDEEIAKLEKDLEGKDLSENELQKTIKLLEEKIATLEAERAESLKQMKAIVEGIQGENELEQCKKEWNELELELELRDSISAPGSEKTDTQKELWSKMRTSFEVRMKEFDECLKDRHALQEEMACLKDLHLEQKKELECVTQEKGKMNEKITEKETEVETIRQSSSEIINDLEMQLKGRQDSALELQEKATFLSKKVAQSEAEKLESDKKIKALMESLNAKEDMSNHLKEKRNAEENNMVLLMKNSEEKIMTLEKELQDRSESETALQNKVCSLKLRISELDDEKNEREESTKTLLEAINTKKNLEEYVQKKDEVEKQLLRKVEEMKTEFARLRSAKQDLERQLVSQPISQVSSEKSQNLKDDSGVEESAEREKQLKNQLENLSDEKLKTEKLLKEKESQVLLLATNNSEAKIEDLENKLRCKSVSEVELQGRMRLLENKIFLLEGDKVRHSTSISSMVRVLKAREELSGVIKARDDAEKEYNIKLDEMEVIVKKLRKEKRKQDCDMELKKRYKNEYEESRRIVKEISEDIYRYNERVEELQAIVDGHEEQEDQKQELDEADLSENIGDLRSSLGTSDVELFQTQQTLQAKISDLEVEKAEFESVITALLDSMEAKEKIEYSVEATREVDKKIVKQMDEILDAVQRLKSEKERLEQELYASENMRAVITLDAEVLQTQSDEKISLLEQSLKESFQLEKDLKERLELMSEELARLEGEKYQADKTVQTMLASLQGREKLEKCVREKERLETMLESKNKRTVNMDLQEAKSVASLIELLQSKELQVEQCQREKEEAVKSLKAKELELELRGKDAGRQSHDFEECLREKNENFKILVGEIEKLKASLMMVEEDKKGLLQKLEKHRKVSEEREEQVNEITQREQNLLQRLSYAENNLQQLKEDKQALKKQLKQEQLERQDASNRYMDEIRRESDAMEQKHADAENELHQMIKQLNSQIAVIQNEKETFIERHKKTAENLNLELLFYCKREEKLRRQMDELEDEVKQTKEELKKQVRLQEEKEMEFEKLQSERIVLSENVSKMESKLRKELENRSTREAELLEEKDIEIKKLRSENDVFVENLKTKMLKLEMELEYQVKNEEKHSKREEKLRRQMDELEDEVKQTKEELKKQVKLQEEKEMEFAKLRSERNVLSENVSKIESKLRKELENRSTREAELREEKDIEIKKLKSGNDVVVENLKTKMLKLQMELEYQLKNEGKLREEKKKVIEELKLQDNLKKEIDQLKSTIKNLEEEGRKLGEERRDLQSEAARSAQTSKDTIARLQEDLKDLHDDNKELQDKLNEMKSKESCFNEEKQRHEKEISVYEDRIKKQKDYLEKFQRKLKKQKEHEQCMKGDLTSQVNELQLKITRLTEKERGQEEEKAEYENNVRRLKLHTENLETQINDQKDELVESRAKISALEDIKVQSDAQHERQQHEVVSECKRANEKIDELRKELRLDLKSTSALENEIKTLKGKTAEINQKTESQKTEIAHIYSLSKGKLTKGEKQLEKLKKGSEELRGQVLCLQEEKKGLAGAVDEHQLFVARHRIEMERLENKIKEQEEKMSNCQAQSSENTQGIEAIQSSLDNSERLRNTWHFYDDFKKWYHSTQSVQRPYSRIGLYRTTPRFY